MNIKHGLVEEFNNELKEVSKMAVGSDEHGSAVESLTKLADRIIEIEKFESENTAKIESQRDEVELKAQQLKDEKRDKITRNGITLGLGIASLIAYGLTYKSSMHFEEKGIMPTTEAGRNSLRNLLKLKF